MVQFVVRGVGLVGLTGSIIFKLRRLVHLVSRCVHGRASLLV